MLKADQLYANIMRGCLDGKAFTETLTLGQYRTETVQDGDSTEERMLDSTAQIQDAAAEVKKLAERCPELKVKYPQKQVSESQPAVDENSRVTVRQTDAVISVPEDFARLHGGFTFRELLETEWKAQTEALTEEIIRRLRKHEIRTAALFGKPLDRTQIRMKLTADEIATEIWRIPYEKCGLYPLQWDNEICGMAQLLKPRLYDLLKEDCGDSQVISVLRNETEQYAVLRLTYMQMEE